MVSGTTSGLVGTKYISNIEAWSYSMYAWHQEFEFELFFNFKRKNFKNKISKISKKYFF
jgi:hypothetical protein